MPYEMMTYVVLFILISLITGFLITYLLDVGHVNSRTNNHELVIRPTLNSISDHHFTTPSSHHLPYSLMERIVYGVVIGLGLHTWVVYLFSLLWGLQDRCIYLSISLLIVFSLIFIIFRWNTLKMGVKDEVLRIKNDFLLNRLSYYIHIAVFLFFAVIFLRLFYRTIIWHEDGMYIGLPNNYGDLPLHLGYITSFAWGNNIPPQNPSLAGKALTYPIMSDFLSAIFLKLGLGFREILFIPGLVLTVAFYGVLYYFTIRLTRRRLAAIIAPFIFFFAGGFGFYHFFQDIANRDASLWSFLMHLPRDYTKITSLNYHWITPLTCLNVPQRAFLFGFPITMLIFILLYTGIEARRQKPGGEIQDTGDMGEGAGGRGDGSGIRDQVSGVKTYTDTDRRKEFLFAGIAAGALPFFHTHSFLALLMVSLPLALIFWDWRRWSLFFLPAFILSLPQLLYLWVHVEGEGFFKISLGWMAGEENFLWFWLKNTGIFWFVFAWGLVAIFLFKSPVCLVRTGSLARGRHNAAGYFCLSFLIPFILPNLVLFAPWSWDNIKILIYWFLGATPVAAYGLSCLYKWPLVDTHASWYRSRHFKIALRLVFFVVMLILTLAGGIDVFRYSIAPIYGWKEFSLEEIGLARRISVETPADSVFLAAPIFNHPVFLSGRKTLMGYPPHIWSHGYKDVHELELDIKKMLMGKPEAISLINRYKPDYVTIGPHERRSGVNKAFFDVNYECIMTTDHYSVYDLTKRTERPGGLDKPGFGLPVRETQADLVDNDMQTAIKQGHGLEVKYYSNLSWEGEAVYEEVSGSIEFDWPNEDAKQIPSPFSAIWSGYIDIPSTGTYTFKLTSDDGSWLYIDDKLIIDNGGYHAFRAIRGDAHLEEGKHKMMIKYFDAGGGAIINLLWIPPGGMESKIPVTNLYR